MREGIAISRSQCYAYLEAVERLDNLAAHFVCQFEDIIRRYDCGQTFSSKSSCQKCKVSVSLDLTSLMGYYDGFFCFFF
jgi:hypothetical protein